MAEIRWYEVSMTVDPELAEAIAEVIGRFTQESVVMERAVEFNDAEDEGTPYGPVKVYAYLLAGEQYEETRQRLEEALWHLNQIQPVPEPAYRPVVDENWMEAWKKHYRPIQIGKRILILPAWMEPSDTDRIVVKIDPSMAFGTGTHPTTQLCVELLDKYTLPGQPLIDVGCGSGILSVTALKLGASKAVAVDIDPAAVRSSQENAAANGVLDRLETGVGSVKELLAGKFSLSNGPLVVANILAPVIIRLLSDGLADLVLPGGHIIFSGILDTQAQDVGKAAEQHGLRFVEQRLQNDWVALVYQRA